jgi:sulfide:quinone oxidoreductase
MDNDADGVTRRGVLVGAAAVAGAAAVGCGAAPARKETAVKKILILGAGFGGLETASGLDAGLGDGHEVTLIDRADSFFVGFSKIDVLFGRRSEREVRSRYVDLRASRVRFVHAEITAIDVDARRVETTGGAFGYDYLVVALGADLDPGATPGFRESGGHEFYSMAGAARLAPVIQELSSGTLVLGILGAPYKCPPAPYEVACQLHELFVRRGVRRAIALKMVIPSPRPVPNPGVADALERLIRERDVELVAGAPITAIDPADRKVIAGGGAHAYDLFVGVPAHVPPRVVRASKLAAKGFIEPDPRTLETRFPGVYAIGDVTRIPVGDSAVPKAGAFAEDAARTVVSEILVKEGRGGPIAPHRAQGACYFEIEPGQVARVAADFFGGDKPRQLFEGPSAGFHDEKIEFERSRRARWFKDG